MATTFGSMVTTLSWGLQGLGQPRARAFAAPRPAPQPKMSALFARALSEDSTEALDWLYYASELTSPAEQRYCVGRAQQIDPHNTLVQTELRRIRGF
jgi:hypothetical protein